MAVMRHVEIIVNGISNTSARMIKKDAWLLCNKLDVRCKMHHSFLVIKINGPIQNYIKN